MVRVSQSQNRLPNRLRKHTRRLDAKQQARKGRKKQRIKKAIKKARHLSTVIRRKRLQQKLSKIKMESFNLIEERAKKTWQRAAKRRGYTYKAYRARVLRAHRSFAFAGMETIREYNTQAALIKRGKNRGKYKVLNELTGRIHTVTAANFARSRKLRAYWSQVRWIARAAEITITEAQEYYADAQADTEFSYPKEE